MELRDAFGYFRLGLVTGLVGKQEAVDWADRMIIAGLHDDDRIVELSLSGRWPHSELIWLLSSFDHELAHDRAVELVLAQAGMMLEETPGRLVEIAQGLRLLAEEEVMPADLRGRLAALNGLLAGPQEGELAAALAGLLERYGARRPELAELTGDGAGG